MNAKNRVILFAIILGIIFYILDALIYYLVFAEGNTFLQIFITAVPLSEIYNRLLLIVGILLLGFISSGLISDLSLENEFLKHQTVKTPASMDVNFISSLTYQIRTPLNAIVGFSELLKDPNLSVQSKQTYINHIHTSGNYLLQLINNLSDISKIEADQMALSTSETRINELLDDLKHHFNEQKKEMGKANVELSVKKGVRDPEFTIVTDPNRLKQVLSNLLENAFKNTDEGFVELGYRVKEKNMLEVYVKDTGKGFSMDRLEVIFNRYRKLTDNQNQPFDGVALRLTISKSIVKLLGGNIWASSKLGKGSTFFFNLPFSDTRKEEVKESPKVRPFKAVDGEREWQHKTILIAEDVESNYIYLQELLRPTKANLIWAQNGKEAVYQVKSNKKIDLVLMDILMPEMDGYEASRHVKALRPELPVIAQTAYSIESDRDKEDLKNFDDFLIKPIWSPQLLSAIDKYF